MGIPRNPPRHAILPTLQVPLFRARNIQKATLRTSKVLRHDAPLLAPAHASETT